MRCTIDTVIAPVGSYKVVATSGACASDSSSAAIINAQPSTPSAPTLSAVTQPTCAVANGLFKINNYNASYTYAVNPSAGVIISNDTVIAPAGAYKLVATLNTCSSDSSSAAIINAQPAAPAYRP